MQWKHERVGNLKKITEETLQVKGPHIIADLYITSTSD